jgi:hypothetical protein
VTVKVMVTAAMAMATEMETAVNRRLREVKE